MTINEFEIFKKQAKLRLECRTNTTMPTFKEFGKSEILICSSKGCELCGGKLLQENLTKLIKKQKITNIKATNVGCFGLCAEGPIVWIMPQDIFYVKVKPEDANEILESIKQDKLIDRLLYTNKNGTKAVHKADLDFYKKQKLIVLENICKINTDLIDDYIALGGYEALKSTVTTLTSEKVIKEITDSGLKGRGGAGFPTGKKWSFASFGTAKQKYIVCNGDEGDPGAYMDRTVLECNPHSILEGMAIAGYAIGASKGVIYVRAEYGFAVKKLEEAIKQAYKLGFLGKNIFGSNFTFDISISLGAGAFVCGEETALLSSIEGKRGEPKTRPPYPATSGLFGCPTVINNVETLTNVPNIILKGANWYNKIGTDFSKGTKVFALSGKIKNTGLVEVPIGTKLSDIIFDIGGGTSSGKKFKAVQIGGPSGGCVTTENIDIPVDYNTLTSIGSMMGSGGMIVVDEDTCMVDFARFFLDFTCDESCGKCTPCRIGNKRLLEILTKITNGNGTYKDLELLEELSLHIKSTSLCGLGQSSPNPVLSTMKFFKDEYVEHIKNHKCRAKVCKALISYFITNKCIGCGICKLNCPVKCISGTPRTEHIIDENKCIKCGLCYSKCPVKAIIKKDKENI